MAMSLTKFSNQNIKEIKGGYLDIKKTLLQKFKKNKTQTEEKISIKTCKPQNACIQNVPRFPSVQYQDKRLHF